MRIWLLGAGRFGLKAMERLRPRFKTAEITLIDQLQDRLKPFAEVGIRTICADGITFLERNLIDADTPDWIIPMIPRHVAFEWIKSKLRDHGEIVEMPVPETVAHMLPNPIRGKNGELYVSNADFLCPDDCPEPKDFCTYTGKPRPCILHEKLANLQLDGFRSIVVRSHQLSPGLGGYRPTALFGALSEASRTKKTILVSTACSCHGVIHACRRIGVMSG